jgi:thioredoxin reductase (NADPH)
VEGEEFLANAIIISTGAESIWLNAPGEAEQKGRGISTCATCDGAFFKQEEVLVIGGGDSACEEATFLTRFASKVTLIHRREVFKASTIMYERAANNDKIEIRTFRQVKEWLSDDNGLTGAILEDPRDGSTEEISATGAFIAIGHKPITGFLGGQVETDENGYIIHKQHTMTSVEGVFAAGDVVDTRYKQAITAAGMGCQAAIDAEKWLEENLH